MYKLLILPFAQQDIKDAARWYNSRKADLGKKFLRHLKQKIKYFQQNPYTIAIRYDDVRTIVLDTFPFMIHFVIDEPKKSIIITAILHTSRNPDLWKKDRKDADENE